MNALNINFFLLPTKLLPLLIPTYLHSLISVQPPCATRSSSVVTLSRLPTSSSLRITNRSFRYASPHLWNQLPVSFRQPCSKHPADDVTLSNSPSTYSPLSPSITHSLFHSRLKTHLFHKSFQVFHRSLLAPTWTAFSDYTGPDLLSSTVFHF